MARASVRFGTQHGNGGSQPRRYYDRRRTPVRRPRAPGRYYPGRYEPLWERPRPRYTLPLSPAHWPENPGRFFVRRALRRVSPFIDLWDMYEEYNRFQEYARLAGPNRYYAPPGYDCYSYDGNIDIPHPQCNYADGQITTGLIGPITCSTWHYQNQVPNGSPGDAFGQRRKLVAIGPLTGGIYGCERMNMAHVWHYNNVPDIPIQILPRVVPVPENRPVPAFDPLPEVVPEPRRRPNNRPYQRPVIAASPRVRPGLAHNFLPPRKGTKEKKWRFKDNLLISLLGSLYGTTTEVVDFLDALGQSLNTPQLRSVYRRQKTLQDKARMLWRNYRNINELQGAMNYAYAQFIDFAIGSAFSAAGRAVTRSGYWRSPRGPGLWHRAPSI